MTVTDTTIGTGTAQPAHFLNRELSWLEFNARVLHEAFDARNPLLERLKFVAIFSSNLDEFYTVRVAGLRRQVAAGISVPSPDGLSPSDQLTAINARVNELLAQRRKVLHELLLPALAERSVRLVSMADLTPAEWLTVDEFFESQVFPVLTPLAVDPGHPFPYISNLSLSLAVEIRDPVSKTDHFARVKVPKSLPRWVPFGRPYYFVPLEQVIGTNLGALFPGMEILGWHAFRVTRYTDLELAKVDEAEDLLEMIEQQVFERRFSEVVRLEVQPTMPAHLRSLLLEELREETSANLPPLTEADVQEADSLLDLGDLMALLHIDVPDLKDPPFTAIIPPEFRDLGHTHLTIFDAIRERDVLVHHPFESFQASVEQFLKAAAQDPAVQAIKMTLYRTSGDASIVHALTEAAMLGKQVAVLVELQARGDESNNISWARTLENAGVHVAYGVPGLKTHAKTTLVVRRDADGLRRYVHIGTGNYNSSTSKLYTDIGLFTCSPSIGADVSDLFNSLTGYSRQRLYRKLLVAPANMLGRFLELIEREAQFARDGRGGKIVAKLNALVHPDVIETLYRASQAGVEIDLIVRGICCLKPGVEGLSERIRVSSIIGRFLEHSRIWMFANAGQPEYYIGSADWMPRNLERRVECVTPVDDVSLQKRLESVLATDLSDNRLSWDLAGDGSYRQRQPDGHPERASQKMLIREPWGRIGDDSVPPARASGERLRPEASAG